MKEKKAYLIEKTTSLCPECKKTIEADIFEEKGKVIMKKNCPEHGDFRDTVWSDANMYLKAKKWKTEGKGVLNPFIKEAKEENCPNECGLCNVHKSHTCLANIDLTNRCNLNCPICFANAAASRYLYQPSFEQAVQMLKNLRNQKPVPCSAVQFSGGEPTLYPYLLETIRKAKEMGFSHVQLATNGLLLAKDSKLAQELVTSGLSTVYLQFDGFKEKTYETTRGRKDLLGIKLQAIRNCRHTKPKPLALVLVVTVVRGVNDSEIGEIIKFAISNSDVIRGVIFQPVSFTGRINKEELEKQRYTLSDLAHDAEEQTWFLKSKDFYPVPIVTRISDIASVFKGEELPSFTTHPGCGIATFLFVNKEGEAIPITRFLDVEGLFQEVEKLTLKVKKYRVFIRLFKNFKNQDNLNRTIDKYFGKFINKREMPEGMDLIGFFSSLIGKGDKKTLGEFTWKAVMIGGMHFQDLYNYDIERVKRCVIHYATPDGRIIPFCAYNGGPTYREEIERKYSIPLEIKKEKKIAKDSDKSKA
jgi:uncharacterized radical SAM superfamily Fe-S cluster-containing enzyme